MREWNVHGFEPEFLFYACAETSVGRVLVVMSDRGVVDVIPGDSESEMLERTRQRFPHARFAPDRGVRWNWVAAVVKRIELPGCPVYVPVDLRCGDPLPFAG